jgi:hypothetical protein
MIEISLERPGLYGQRSQFQDSANSQIGGNFWQKQRKNNNKKNVVGMSEYES